MSGTQQNPVSPRLAATVLLLRDDPFQVLMVRRNERKNDSFSSALVFPGGVVDPVDTSDAWFAHIRSSQSLTAEERALRIAASRETYEEAGVLLARGAQGLPMPRGESSDGQSFLQMIACTHTHLDLDAFVHFGHWITPDMSPRRFDTHFYLCAAPPGVEAVCDGKETVALEWVAPRAPSGALLFPTQLNLRRLAESTCVQEALVAARARPRFTVRPNPQRRDGKLVITIPEEAGYGVTESTQL
jgi:8-oxo-dGTP pyrophosphatase MutT (NUDIX family)